MAQNRNLALIASDAHLDGANAVGNVDPSNLIQLQHLSNYLAPVDLTTSAPEVGQTLQFDGTNWIPSVPSAGGAGGAGQSVQRFDYVAKPDQTAFTVNSETVPLIYLNGIALHYPTDFTWADGVATLPAGIKAGDLFTAVGWVTAEAGAGGSATVTAYRGAYDNTNFCYWPAPGAARGYYGSFVAYSGDGLVAATGSNPSGSDTSRAVYIYDIDPVAMTETLRFSFTDLVNFESSADRWGRGGLSLNYDGSVLTVGSPEDNAHPTSYLYRTNSSTDRKGSLGIYDIIGATQTFREKIVCPYINPQTHEDFGQSAAITADGNFLVVGAQEAYGDSSLPGQIEGRVYLYRRNETTNSFELLENYLTEPNDGAINFGSSVAVTDDRSLIAVGAKSYRNEANVGYGGVYFFQLAVFVDSVDNGDDTKTLNYETVGTQAGKTYTRIAGCGEIDPPTGHTWYFKSGFLTQSGTPDVWSQFGLGVALSADGSVLLVGTNDHGPLPAQSGVLLIYDDVGGVWTERELLQAPNENRLCKFGNGIAVNSDASRLLVGATGSDDYWGSVYLLKSVETV